MALRSPAMREACKHRISSIIYYALDALLAVGVALLVNNMTAQHMAPWHQQLCCWCCCRLALAAIIRTASRYSASSSWFSPMLPQNNSESMSSSSFASSLIAQAARRRAALSINAFLCLLAFHATAATAGCSMGEGAVPRVSKQEHVFQAPRF